MFGPLKRHWSDVCHQYQQRNPGVVISKLNFFFFFSQAWLTALSPASIIADFRKCGIHPFNRQAIPLSHEAPTDSAKPTGPSTTEDSTTTKEDGSITKTAPEKTSSEVNFTTQ